MNTDRAPAIASDRGEKQSMSTDSLGAGNLNENIIRQDTESCQADFVFDEHAGPGERFKEE